eukprot:2525459-Rhodomonas_salina.2
MQTMEAALSQPVVSVELEKVEVPEVGLCIAAVDFVSMMCGQTRGNAQACIANMLRNRDKNYVAEILCRKANVPGFHIPTYVVTLTECFDLVQFLPRHRIRNVKRHITSFFNQCHNDSLLLDTIIQLGKRKAEEPSDSSEPGYVYAAYSIGNGMKIGMTCQNDPMARVRALNTCVRNPFQLVDIIRCGNPREVEAFMHRLFAHCSVGDHNRELFDMSLDTLINTFNAVRQAAAVLQCTVDDAIDIKQMQAYFDLPYDVMQ